MVFWINNNVQQQNQGKFIHILFMRTNIIKNKMYKPSPNILFSNNQAYSSHLFQSSRTSNAHTLVQHQEMPTPSKMIAVDKDCRIDVEQFVHLFTSHFMEVQRYFKKVDFQLTKLQSKIAFCFGKFNEIQWKISKQLYEIEQSKVLNESLLQINKEVQIKLQQIQKDYEQLRNRKYLSGMQKRLQQLKESVHKMQIDNYKLKFSKEKITQFQQNIDKLETIMLKSVSYKNSKEQKYIYLEIIKNLVNFLKEKGEINDWLQQKIQENISMKFKIIKLQAANSTKDHYL